MILQSCSPDELGLDTKRLERACAVIGRHIDEGFHPGAQLAVARRGKLALTRCFGKASLDPARSVDPSTLFLLYSNTKVITAATLWTLVEDGLLRFTDPIADHIPGFDAHGKAGITVIDLLTHQAGFPNATVSADCWTDHDLLRRTVCDFRLEWSPRSRVSYHRMAAHWVVAVLIEALTGNDYRDEIRLRILQPLGLSDEIYVGLPETEYFRAAQLYLPAQPGSFSLSEGEATAAFRRAGIPGAGGYATAQAMAAFYQMLAQGGVLNGVRVLSPRMIDYVTRDFTGDRVDEYMGVPMHRGLGPFSRGAAQQTRGLGTIGHARTFGHGGVGSSYCWADPTSGVSCAFLSNCRQNDDWHNSRMDVVSNLVHAAIVN
jgi:CubicO group peptidase (beta-lactamase class C family)